jgi:hypothetical protein
MAEDFSGPSKPKAVWEPGTLDATRKNIGAIDKEEAERMTKVLGGEIMTEKSVPIDYSKLPKRAPSHRVVRPTNVSTSSGKSSSSGGASSSASNPTFAEPKKKVTRAANLPQISSKDNAKIDRLMMSDAFAIKPNYGLFNFIKKLSKDGSEKVIPEFAEITLKAHLDHINAFITVIKSIIQFSPDTYKARVQNETELKFRFLRKVSEWSTKDAKLAYVNLETLQDTPVVADLLPFVKSVYRMLITVHYIGEPAVARSIKEIYADLLHYPNADKDKFSRLAKEAITEWMYLYTRIIKGLYPLLMRMCGTPYDEFPHFFVAQVSTILNFLGLKKFDLLLPEKKVDPEEVRKAKEAENKAKEAEEKKKEQEKAEASQNEIVEKGIALLDRLFPGAGFKKLDTFPDMWPYFDPLYDFDEAYLMLAPENPLQITIILCEILQDLFRACNKMQFNVEGNPTFTSREDNLTKALSEWPVYVDTLFSRDYGEQLKQLVNQTYTQANYITTRAGKKCVTDILWLTKYSFLPHFTFEQLLLERPINNNKYLALFIRTAFLRDAFNDMTKQISQSEKNRGTIGGLNNPWAHYDFEITSPISKRIDVLLNAKDKSENTTASNANLIKYISCIISVLDWWINSRSSPAYKADSRKIYRTVPGTQEPAFSVEPREDQDSLFAAAIRAAVQKKA